MISPHIVKLAIEYLDSSAVKGERCTLVGMHWYVDGRNKTLPVTEEVNAALAQRPSLFVVRENETVLFSVAGLERAVTVEDMRLADTLYRKEFSAASANLKR